MARTRTTPTAKLSPKYGTSSGTNPEEDFDSPEDLSDMAGIDAEIPRGNARPTGSLLEPKPKPRSPIGVEIGKSAGGGLGVVVSVPIAGGPISGRGGINLGAGGAIKGGSIGLGFGLGPIGGSIDVGTDQDEATGQGGCYQYVTISVGPFAHTYGRNVCEPKPPKEPALTEDPGGGTYKPPNIGYSPNNMPPLREECIYHFKMMFIPETREYFNKLPSDFQSDNRWERIEVTPNSGLIGIVGLGPEPTYEILTAGRGYLVKGSQNSQWVTEDLPYYRREEVFSQAGNVCTPAQFRDLWQNYYLRWFAGQPCWMVHFLVSCGGKPQPYVPPSATLSAPSPPLSPPVPNPPPKKKMNDKCCKALMLMMLMQHKHLGVTPIPGVTPLQIPEVTQKGEKLQAENMNFPFEVPKRWLDPTAKKEDKILVKNVSELLFIMGSQSERLERVIGTKEFVKDSEGKLRQSEGNLGSWLSGKNPDFAYPDPNDFWLNTDDGIIKEKRLEVRSLTDAIRYVVEMGNRLERILPIAELKDSSIPKRWIYPGAKGQQRVGNLIHLLELMVRSDDKHRGYWPVKVKVKDADPAIKDDQPVELEFHSQADVFRELFQFLIDMEGDGDMSSNFALRSAFQTCQMHQLTVQNNAMLDAIVEYLDFKVNKTVAKVPMPFNPFAGISPSLIDQALAGLGIVDGMPLTPSINSNKESDIEALAPNVLQNTLVEVDIVECDESKTLNESLLELLKHSSAASAAVSERVSESAIDRVISAAGLAQKLTSFLTRRDVTSALGIGDLDKWVNSAETGYTDSPESQGLRFPESDPLQPYGRPIAENPRIKEIDTKEPKAD